MNSNRLSSYFLWFFSVLLLLMISFTFFFVGKFLLNTDSAVESQSFNTGKYTIVVDAGHGGKDGGASCGGIFEKDLTLSISKEICEVLKMYDVNVVMTRTSDVLLADDDSKNKKRDDLLNRYKIAQDVANPLFVSIHINKFPESKYKGLQVFYSPNNPLSESMALLVQSRTKDFLQKDNTRMIKEATSSIYLLDRLKCPAILVECGFISNDEEAQLLSNLSYQKRLAFIISNSIIEFINI